MRELKWLRENAAFIREGVVTDDSPLTSRSAVGRRSPTNR